MVISPTHIECEAVTEAIRTALKTQGVLKGGKQCDILRNLSWTRAQKRDPRHYQPGLIVKVNGNVKGFRRNEQLEVVKADDKTVLGRDSDGDIRELPLAQPKAFSVFEKDSIEICEGDRIRITANGRSAENHRLSNGSFHQVDYISHDGKIVLENGWRLEKDFAMLDFGYAATSHACQGKTVDFVFVAQSAISSGASDAKQFYVSISRGREGGKVVTEDIDFLRQTVARQRNRKMAMEIILPAASECLGEHGIKMNPETTENLRRNVKRIRERRAERQVEVKPPQQTSKEFGRKQEIQPKQKSAAQRARKRARGFEISM